MTPTEQDKELRDDIISILRYSELDIVDDADAIMQLIIADRKRVALEARIHELGALEKYYVPEDDYAIYPAIESRIDELKAQQELEKL